MTRPSVLIVDDKFELASAIADGLADAGYDATPMADPVKAMSAVRAGHYDALVTDLRMPVHDGFELLAASRASVADAPVIIMTAFSAIDSAVEAIRRGAAHYLTKPFQVGELALFLGRALDEGRLRRESRAMAASLRDSLPQLVGDSQAMREVSQIVRRVADADVPVLVKGETGTGKGLVARALHSESRRAERPFVSVNCAALPDQLLESELFGHARGAFTGATSARVGLFATADGGTLFLDEIGDLAPALQAKLLSVLETGRYRPVGEDRERAADVRIITATHRDLLQAASFRQDLRFRLEVVTIELPALRFRPDDLPALVESFLQASRGKYPQAVPERLGVEALEVFRSYAWPGNVRELAHVIERAVLLGQNKSIGLSDLPRSLLLPPKAATHFEGPVVPMREMQKRYAAWALAQKSGHKKHTCEALELDLKTLNRLLLAEGAE